MRFNRLSVQIWVTFTAVILAITLCLLAVFVYGARRMEYEAKIQDLSAVHEFMVTSEIEVYHRFDVIRNLREASHFVYFEGNIYPFAMRWRASIGQHTHRDLLSPGIDVNFITHMLATIRLDNTNSITFRRTIEGISYIFIISPVDNGMFLVSYMPNIYDNDLMYFILVIGGISIIIGLIAAKVLANNITKPLSKLEVFTQKIATKEWHEPIVLDSKDEIGRLAKSMNEMQLSLKRADEEEKLFLQNISHDLKTPVMVIMSHADAILDGIYVDTLDKTATIIKDEAERLSRKIKQLLFFNTLDHVFASQQDIVNIRLDRLVKRLMERFEAMSSQLKINLEIDLVEVNTIEDKLYVAIENIVDNAVRYAKTEINISLKQNNDSFRLIIFNDGDRIDQNKMNVIFNTHYKGDKGNFGLGLAITNKIISFFGGTVFVQNAENGVSFIIDCPLQPNNSAETF